jgi:hypothetical protein
MVLRSDIKKDPGDETAYGKAIFAEHVVRKLAKPTDFDKFDRLLQPIEGVIDDYARRLSEETPHQVETDSA